MSNDVVYVLNLDADGVLISATMNGVEGTFYEDLPTLESAQNISDPREVVWSHGSDPENGDGTELEKFGSLFCIHHMCRRICW